MNAAASGIFRNFTCSEIRVRKFMGLTECEKIRFEFALSKEWSADLNSFRGREIKVLEQSFQGITSR